MAGYRRQGGIVSLAVTNQQAEGVSIVTDQAQPSEVEAILLDAVIFRPLASDSQLRPADIALLKKTIQKYFELWIRRADAQRDRTDTFVALGAESYLLDHFGTRIALTKAQNKMLPLPSRQGILATGLFVDQNSLALYAGITVLENNRPQFYVVPDELRNWITTVATPAMIVFSRIDGAVQTEILAAGSDKT